jgi:hypothetical protein
LTAPAEVQADLAGNFDDRVAVTNKCPPDDAPIEFLMAFSIPNAQSTPAVTDVYNTADITILDAPCSNSGRALNGQWGVGARDAKYHQPGTLFENLRAFLGALFDRNGYVLFETEDEYRRTPGLSHGQKLNVRKGISSLPGYVRRTA